MKLAVLLSLGALAIPSVVAAQSSAPTAAGASFGVIINSTCPVSMQAKQGSGSGLVKVKKSQPKDGESVLSNKPGQHIHLILGKRPAEFSNFQQITGATVTARGLSARGHLDRTPADIGNETSDLHRTLSVTFSAESDGTLYADLDLPGFTSVRSIQIESLSFKDSSIWNVDSVRTCVVTPDPLMLVASQ